MTKAEFKMIVAAITTYYDNAKFTAEKCELWSEQLSDIPYDVMQVALKKWVSLNKWSPTIADLREYCSGACAIPDWSQGWEEVMQAVRTYGTYRANEAVESLSEVTRETVKRIGFVNICQSEYIISERAQFEKIYNTIAERKKENLRLAPNVRNLIETMSMKMISENAQ